jgi:uncharacterized membrane protein YcaP (DUF421 family)
MNVAAEDLGLPLGVVSDGRLLSHNLKTRGLNEIWLKTCLKNHGLSGVEDVFLLTVDEKNNVYCAAKAVKG